MNEIQFFCFFRNLWDNKIKNGRMAYHLLRTCGGHDGYVWTLSRVLSPWWYTPERHLTLWCRFASSEHVLPACDATTHRGGTKLSDSVPCFECAVHLALLRTSTQHRAWASRDTRTHRSVFQTLLCLRTKAHATVTQEDPALSDDSTTKDSYLHCITLT